MTRELPADAYFESTPDYSPKRLEFAVPHLRRLEAGSRLIDIGCGTGTALATFAPQIPMVRLAGLDPSKRSLELASKRIDFEPILGSVLDPTIVSQLTGEFDAAVMAAVLHHVVGPTRAACRENARGALDATARLLRPGGHLYLFEPCYEPAVLMAGVFWIKRVSVSLGIRSRPLSGPDWVNPGPPVVSYLTPHELADLVQESFRIVEHYTLSQRTLGRVMRKTGVAYVLERT